MSDAATAPAPRPWHLTPSTAPGATAGGGDTSGPPTDPAADLSPLWYRIVTGRSFAWRIRGIRRRTARRVLRWLDAHPEVRDAARTGELRRLAGLLPRRRHHGPTRPTHRPVVHLAARVAPARDDGATPPSPLLDAVDLRTGRAGPTDAPELVVDDDGTTVEVTGPDDGHVRLPSPVDIRHWNPTRFQARPSPSRVALGALPLGDDVRPLRRLHPAHRGRVVACVAPAGLPDDRVARRIIELACSGAPLGGVLSPPVAEIVGPELTALLATVDPDDPDCLADDRRRTLHTLDVRRAAFARFAPRDQWARIGTGLGIAVQATPSVSVLLPSNRPDDVVDAARRVAAQRDVDVQLVVGLHGSHMPADLDARLAEHAPADLVVRRLADDLNLGQVMNELTAAADGDLVSKWDDDDWYDPHHLGDLVRALEYAGAAMVGKAAEFVYLEALDLTIRRFATGAERPSTTVAGGTLLLTRDDLVDIGWAPVARQVDRRLIDALQDRGLGVYRTHGFGYVLRRRGGALAQHTWRAGDGYFLRQASDQRPGLDLDFAGIAEGTA